MDYSSSSVSSDHRSHDLHRCPAAEIEREHGRPEPGLLLRRADDRRRRRSGSGAAARRDALRRAEPLGLHVPVLPPGRHVHAALGACTAWPRRTRP